MAQDTPSRKLDQYIVRFPDGLRDRIKAAAEENKRSMNAEIVATLEEKYPAPQGDPVRELLELIENELAARADHGERQAFLKKLISMMADDMAKPKP